MAKFFTVDRWGTLSEGMELCTQRHTDINLPELQEHVDFLFSDGVSRHGDAYFLSNESKASVTSPAIELLFEYVRRSYFPNKPSRFTSFFGVSSLPAAVEFNARFGARKGAIWEVEASDYFRGDMNLLTSNATTLVHSYFAHLYWKGEDGPIQPFWEVLLVPPVRVLRQIIPAVSCAPSLNVSAVESSA